MALAVFKKLGLRAPTLMIMWLLRADHMVKKLMRIVYDVLVKVKKIIFLADIVILYCEVNFHIPIILRRPFLATGRALVDMEVGQHFGDTV